MVSGFKILLSTLAMLLMIVSLCALTKQVRIKNDPHSKLIYSLHAFLIASFLIYTQGGQDYLESRTREMDYANNTDLSWGSYDAITAALNTFIPSLVLFVVLIGLATAKKLRTVSARFIILCLILWLFLAVQPLYYCWIVYN